MVHLLVPLIFADLIYDFIEVVVWWGVGGGLIWIIKHNIITT